jgi:hypothetical protein
MGRFGVRGGRPSYSVLRRFRMKTQEDLLKYHERLTTEARALMKGKNTDYAKDQIFGNLDVCENVGLCSTEMGILIRIFDKLSRLKNVLEAGQAEVKDESVQDTLLDVINYATLIGAKQVQRRED